MEDCFLTPTGHFEYCVMSYGLVNIPSVFQDFMHEVFLEYLHRFIVLYIKKISVYSQSLDDIVDPLRRSSKN